MSEGDVLVFYCNWKKIEERNPDPECSLASYLRVNLRLTGTKISCGQGGCGACTVMLSSYSPETKQISHIAVNACLMPVCAVHGKSVTTIEALGSVDKRLHPIQERIAKFHGTQCGFCTPGMVMSMYTLLRNNPEPTKEEIETVLQGNLCRCTGYRPILNAFNTFTQDFKCAMGENCCSKQPKPVSLETLQRLSSETVKVKVIANEERNIQSYDPTQELIFPNELQINASRYAQGVKFIGPRVIWVKPMNYNEYVRAAREYPEAKLISGNCGLGVASWYNPTNNIKKDVVICVNHMNRGWFEMNIESDGIRVRAALTLMEVHKELTQMIEKSPESATRNFSALTSIIDRYAGNQIRSVVTLGGIIAGANPESDVNTVLVAARASIRVFRDYALIDIPLDENFFLGSKRTALKPLDFIEWVLIPTTHKTTYVLSYKQGRKLHNDSAIVNSCFSVDINELGVTEKAILVYGGVSDRTIVARKTASIMIGKQWNYKLVDTVIRSLHEEIQIPIGSHGGKEEYKRSLVLSLFFKYYMSVHAELKTEEYATYKDTTPRKPCKGTQVIVEVPDQDINDPIGRPLEHLSAFKNATGEARFLDDTPVYQNELHMALVLSSEAHALIKKIDARKALALPGVVAFYTHKSVRKEYFEEDGFPDDKMFAKDKVTCEGQPIGAIVAESHALAQKAAKLVEVEYDPLPAIVTIKEAIAEESVLGDKIIIPSDDTETWTENSDRILVGEVQIGGQKHFYLETQSCLVVPRGEDNALDIYSSTQWPHIVQMGTASALGIQASKIEVHSKRMGGAFGGKSEKALIPVLPAALAATKLKRPIRCVLSMDDDMIAIGSRHTVYAQYKVGCKNDGRITGVNYKIFSNGGHKRGCTPNVLQMTLVYTDNSYKFENMMVEGVPLMTNTPSNTACRSSGSFQGVFLAENLIHHVATELNLDPLKIREMHLYKNDDVTHYGQKMENVTVRKCWEEVMTSADVDKRKKDIEDYNRDHKFTKRGIAMVPVKYGIGFPALVPSQAGALLQVYLDGTVLVSHGGTEYGQGINTKMTQIVSRALGIRMDLIYINETTTSKVPNASATGGSTNTDLYGAALLNACNELNDRLKSVKEKNPEGTWLAWIKEAYAERISLSVFGFYRLNGITDIDWETGRGSPFPYYTFGAACSEVEIDALTGAHTIIRTDMVIDIGQSLNPAIDVGQIEGAFVMGLGLVLYEERLYTVAGKLATRGPLNYKIPGCTDIPSEFNVSLLKGSSNPKAVYSSKGIGEPTMHCSLSVFFAIKEAIRAARIQNGLGPGHFRLNSPATSEAIRLACGDNFAKMSQEQRNPNQTVCI